MRTPGNNAEFKSRPPGYLKTKDSLGPDGAVSGLAGGRHTSEWKTSVDRRVGAHART